MTQSAIIRQSPWRTRCPEPMVRDMRQGRYAVQISDSPVKWSFVKVWRPTKGPRTGQIVISTQHGERFKPLVTLYPSGSNIFSQTGIDIDTALLMIAADPVTSGINYGRELGHCCRCGKELTDNRSRYYAIGPECEKHWPEVINQIDTYEGVYVS